MPNSSENGFALVEVLIALAIAALVLVVSTSSQVGSSQFLTRLLASKQDLDRDWILERRIAEFMGALDPTQPLIGSESQIALQSLLAPSEGSTAVTAIVIDAAHPTKPAMLRWHARAAEQTGGARAWSRGPVGFRFLGDDREWTSQWHLPVLPRLIAFLYADRPPLLIAPLSLSRECDLSNTVSFEPGCRRSRP